MKEIAQSRQQADKAGRYQTGLGERRTRVHTVNEISNWIKKAKEKRRPEMDYGGGWNGVGEICIK